MGQIIVEESTGAVANRGANKRFVKVWATALALSLVVLYFELDTLVKSLHDFGWSTLKSDTMVMWLFGQPDSAAAAAKHVGEPHGSPHIVAAAVQIAAAAAISWMWFGAFRILGRAQSQERPSGAKPGWLVPLHYPRLSRLVERICCGWWAVGMASFVVVLFAFTMHQAYQPAVLVMALIAIVVAAEHYSGLKEAVDDLRKVEGFTSRLAEDAGLSHFEHDVYERYASAKKIHAVVRMHDIDPVWWSIARGANDPWEEYVKDAKRNSEPKDATAERRNLARALRRDSGELKACFVTDLPMPGSEEWNRRLRPDDGEPLFGDFLGFAWQWIVLQEVQKTWKRVDCRAWVSRPLCWIHATDRVVFQVLRREPRSRSAVLVIADRDGLSLSAGAEETYRGMVQWANEEVRRYADRGCTAEDYLLAVLRYAAALASKQGDAGLVASGDATADLRYLLELLGAPAWIASTARKSTPTLGVLDDELVFQASAKVFVKALVAMFPGQSRISVRDLWGRLA
ncbi:hypothetical protein [Hydrogenophaga sp. Root209]|uniref:hypothetical protein n=1 Tax=Hydrogenophaga sp. Root209 TaxID=1736490 RepID=UPI000AA0C3A0|nr:hypothetical protein [Hydrogenophaga sp. Root209]